MDEKARLKKLHQYQILDTAPEQAFDDITSLAAMICETPIAVVSLVDDTRQWFKSAHGLGDEVKQTDRCIAFCDYAIRDEKVLVVNDATKDSRFSNNPLVTNAPNIRFYAGAPLITPDRYLIGTLCVIGTEPKTLTTIQIESLARLARQIVHLLEARLQTWEQNKSSAIISLLSNAAASANSAVIAFDTLGEIISWNEAAESIFGYTEKELIGQPLSTLLPERVHAAHRGYLEEYIETGKSPVVGITREIVGVQKNGTEIPIEVLISTWGQDQHSFYTCYVKDISGRRKEFEALEKKVKERTAELTLLTESIPQIVWQMGPSGELLYMNSKWNSYTGQKADGASWSDILHPDDVEAAQRSWAASLATGKEYDCEYRLKAKDGTFRWFLARGVSQKDAAGNVLKWFGTCTDVQSQKEIEETIRKSEVREKAALEASKLKSEFLANMSHEIRTPINGVIGMTNLLLDTPLTAEQKEYASASKSAADSLLSLINDILDFSKVEAGKLEFDNIDFDLLELLADTERTFGYSAKSKMLDLKFEINVQMPRHLKGDPGRLRQVFNNLLSNAMKFTPRGSVTLRARCPKQVGNKYTLQFEVEDTGIGIPASAMARIFTAFSQADSSTTRRFGGTGLGLSISKHLIEHMAGSISASSEEGRGSTFRFEISLDEGVSVKRDTTIRKLELAKGLSGKPRVLLAEDNIVNQKIGLKLVEKMGLLGHAVGNGKEALIALTQSHYDLVLMDCQMPEMDGYETTRRIRSEETYRNVRTIPIIAMTANALKGDREKCLESGMNGYVSKPVDVEELTRLMEQYLGEKTKPVSGVVSEMPIRPKGTLDQSALDALRSLDGPESPNQTLHQLITMFLENTTKQLAQIQEALPLKDLKAIKSLAHSLKSSSASLGAIHFSELCKNLEHWADSSTETPEALVASILAEFSSVERELRGELTAKAA